MPRVGAPGSFADLTAQLAPAVVNIATRQKVQVQGQNPFAGTPFEVAAADNLKRVRRAPAAEPDWTTDPGLDRMTHVLETKTVWHPIGV